MRKFYSIVLMATALLIGTNMQAKTITVGVAGTEGAQYNDLATAFAAADSNDEIKLLSPISISTQNGLPIWIGETDMAETSGTGKNLTLDLNGFTLTRAYNRRLFDISHGSLTIKTSRPGGQILDGEYLHNSGDYAYEDLIVIAGSYLKDNNPKEQSNYYSHLLVEEGVVINSNQNVVVIDEPTVITRSSKVSNYRTINYDTKVYKGTTKGVSHGVRVDIKGTLNGQKYAVKANGTLGAPFKSTGVLFESAKEGYVVAAEDVNYSPYIYVHSSAVLTTASAAVEAVAAYSSGYARWCIKGYCGGSTGLYAKSGEIELIDAEIESTNPSHSVPEGKSAGVNAGGSAIVIESNASFAGGTSVTISGDTKVTAAGGYAIEETITTAAGSKVDNITIAGGTLNGGNAGAIYIEDKTKQEDKVSVIGGNVSGDVQTTTGQTSINELLDETKVHTTTVVVNGKPTVVISQGAGPADEAKKTAWNDVAALSNKTNPVDAAWTAVGTGTIGDGTTATTIYLGELQMISGTGADAKQVLTIKNKSTLEVKHLMMNDFAQIIVEAGAKLIVNGTQGIVAPVVDNIVLQASETDQAVFLFNPAVKSNRHPNATVQMYAKAHHDADGTWHSQHFGIPTYGTPAITWPAGTTYLYRSEESGWVNITSLDQLEPFVGYALNNSSETAAGVYTFKGELNGNTDAPISFVKTNYNLVANSYAAPMSMKALFDDLQSQYGNAVELSAWIYESAYDRHTSITKTGVEKAAEEDPTAVTTIAPMQGFILYCGTTKPANGTIGYTEAIWNNPNKTGVAIKAPARSAEDNSVRATIVVSTEKSQDQVVLRESDEYSSAFDNGADAHKYMSERVFDLYSENGEENYSDVATDNLEGTTLTLKAKAETAYTMSFRNVNNFNYVVRDNLSGAIIPVEEGTTYDFYMAEGTTANGRFEIVGRQNMPTAIENTEAVKSAKGVYTILGQYLGESNILNTLPSGIYVVDGQRIVK